MKEWQWQIIDILMDLFECGFLYAWFFKAKFEVRSRVAKPWLCLLIFPTITYLFDLLVPYPTVKLFVLLFIGIFIIYGVFDCSMRQAIVANIVFSVLLIISETIASGILLFIHNGDNVLVFIEHSALRIEGFVLSKLFHVIFLILFVKFMKGKRKSYSVKEIGVLMLQGFSSTLCLLMIIELSYYQKESYSGSMIFLVLIGVAVLISYIVSYYLIDRYFEYREQEKEQLMIEMKKEKLLSSYKAFENTQQKVYQLYHDLKKHLNVVNMMENKEEVSEYLNKCFDGVQDIEGKFATGNEYADMFLYDEWKQANDLGIKAQFAVENNSLNQVELQDIIVILGNALENAREACKKKLDKQERAFMQLKVKKVANQIIMVISNNYTGKLNKKDNLFLTSKTEKGLHGIGMKSMNNSVKKYQGSMNVSVKNEKFVLKIMLNLDEI